jgi:branched-chain amino acid transport system ATP-binding protein
VKSLTKNFRGLTAVKDLSLKVQEGEIVGLIGPNGSGKTTTFNLLSGFLKPSEGRIFFRGQDITNVNSPNQICRKGIGRTFQIVKPFGGMSVLENVMVGALRKRNMDDAVRHSLQTIQLVGLWDYRSELASNLPIPLLKRLELAKAFSCNPQFLLLDECMAGLNSTEKNELTQVLREIKMNYAITMMIIEHDMRSIMSLSDRVIVLNYGTKIAEGAPVEITRNPEVISAYLGIGG